MGRHRAPRRHAPVAVLVAAGVVGSAGIAWAVGSGPDPEPDNTVGTAVSPSATSVSPFVTAPTPRDTASPTPVVSVVPSPTATPTTPTAGPATATTADPGPTTAEPTATAESSPKAKPPHGRPTRTVDPKPTKTPR